MQTLNYFAYGSNMLDARLQNRVKSARALGTARLSGYRLCFNVVSTDGSAKCNIVKTGDELDAVLGVVFALNADEKPTLDRCEMGYLPVNVCLEVAGERIEAFVYIAAGQEREPVPPPYKWYKDFVLWGARQHRLPEEYIAKFIEPVEALVDTDWTRAARNERILNAGLRGFGDPLEG